MISNDERRYAFGRKAAAMIKRFGRDRILDEWEQLFNEIR